MGAHKSPEKTFGVDSERVDRAKKILTSILNNPKIDIWPDPHIKNKAERVREIARAQSLQTYTLLIGGVAVFAYVFTHKEELSTNISQQIRDFKVGIIDGPDTGLAALSGVIKASRKMRRDGTVEHSIEPEFDAEALENADLDSLEVAAQDLHGSNESD